MKRALASTLLIAVSVSLVAGMHAVEVGRANPLIEERYDSLPIISINSPENGAYINSILLNITVKKSADWLSMPVSFGGDGLSQKLVSVSIHVDGNFYWLVRANSDLVSPFNYSLNITDLADGSHTIMVQAESTGVVRDWISSKVYSVPIESVFATVHFTLDATPPAIVVMPFENLIYDAADIALNFTVAEPFSQITYCLDGQKNVTVAGNTTLTDIPYGEHNIRVFATDEVGNTGASETIYFTIEEPPEPFPTTFMATASVASVAAIGVGLLVYFKKRKR